MKDETFIILSAIYCITFLEAINLVITGIDSVLFSMVISTISGLGGYLFGKKKRRKRKKGN